MGYYSTINLSRLAIKKDKVEDLRGLFAKIKIKEATGSLPDWEAELNWMSVNEDGDISCEECYCKWYETDLWTVLLLPYVEDESTIDFVGESGDRWGYLYENGKIYHIEYVMCAERVHYAPGETKLSEKFIKEYSK